MFFLKYAFSFILKLRYFIRILLSLYRLNHNIIFRHIFVFQMLTFIRPDRSLGFTSITRFIQVQILSFLMTTYNLICGILFLQPETWPWMATITIHIINFHSFTTLVIEFTQEIRNYIYLGLNK